jgi:hexosaminidase
MKSFLFFILLVVAGLQSFCQQVNIIPQPVSVKLNRGTFTITNKTVFIIDDAEAEKSADFFNAYLENIYGFRLAKGNAQQGNYIKLVTKKNIEKPSSDVYNLVVTPSGVTISGDTYSGIFYGTQTLIQLLPVTKNVSLKIPAVTIADSPRFNYRGMMLDVGRHFFPVPVVKKYIDYIALHKMNYFHWHLTEDQGWRIEIKKYPLLTEVGSTRQSTIIGHFPGTGNDNIKHSGFYTQDEIRDVVKYAADRFITVVPEIEMPGHAEAALTSYPWLGCPGTGPYKVEETWGVFNNVFCAGKDSTFQFLQDVMDEVLQLFPGPYIHVGGDECPKNNWKLCPLCQARIKAEGLKDEHGLQSYFIQRMEKYINSKGRKMIGWDEILEGGLAPNATVMSWRGEQGGIDAAKQNHDVIMTPGGWVYFDHAQVQKDDSLTIGGYLPVEKVYGYEPIPKELNAEQAKHILGAQANLWTEYIPYPSKIEYMIFPRMSALSEVLWSPKNQRNWKLFEPRLKQQFKRYDLWKSSYCKATLTSTLTRQKNKTTKAIK